MGFKYILTKDARHDLRGLAQQITKRILKKILWIATQNDPVSFGKMLKNSPAGDVRFRVGDYRVIASIDYQKETLTITAIGHRREIYS